MLCRLIEDNRINLSKIEDNGEDKKLLEMCLFYKEYEERLMI